MDTMPRAANSKPRSMIRSNRSRIMRLPTGGNNQIAKINPAATAPTTAWARPQNRHRTMIACRAIIGAATRNSHPEFMSAHSMAASAADPAADMQ